jgi:hypothetical protein
MRAMTIRMRLTVLLVAVACGVAACSSSAGTASPTTTSSGTTGATATPTASNTITSSTSTPTTTRTATPTTVATTPEAVAAAATLTSVVTNGTCEDVAKHPAVQADNATVDGDHIRVSGHRAQLTCGGMSDSHFSVSVDFVTVTLPANMPVSTVELTANGIGSKQRAAAELPAYLPTDNTGHWFVVSGTYEQPTAFAERFQA